MTPPQPARMQAAKTGKDVSKLDAPMADHSLGARAVVHERRGSRARCDCTKDKTRAAAALAHVRTFLRSAELPRAWPRLPCSATMWVLSRRHAIEAHLLVAQEGDGVTRRRARETVVQGDANDGADR